MPTTPPRLSIAAPDASQIAERYDVVVVGSGYGGAIAASRLARAGRSVCVLERGREHERFPDRTTEAAAETQFDLPFLRTGRRDALFDFRLNHEMNVVVGCGLGGTSLINAGVVLRPTPELFEDPRWPRALRQDLPSLERGFAAAGRMLEPATYPDDQRPLPKLEALGRAARASHQRFYKAPVAVSFADRVNAAGVAQKACTLCGDCVTGCNHGAKGSLVMNYLPDARRHGAAIFTQVWVSHVERFGAGWQVCYQVLATGHEDEGEPLRTVVADLVVLAAGTLGSTEILLRSRAAGLPVSARVGERFSGNGDVLAFAYRGESEVRAVGMGEHPSPGEPVGPTITGVIDLRDGPDRDAGVTVQEAAIPAAVAKVAMLALGREYLRDELGLASIEGLLGFRAEAESEQEAVAAAGGEVEEARPADAESIGDIVGAALGGGGERAAAGPQAHALLAEEAAHPLGLLGRGLGDVIDSWLHHALGRTLAFVTMSFDDGQGRMSLEDGRLRIHWPGVGDQPNVERVNRVLAGAARALGARLVTNPVWSRLFNKGLISVHPLGGCVMADAAERGVVDDRGRVFAGASGAAVHDGLHVLDGSIVPMPLGTNPLFTICALAERACAHIAAERGWTIA